MLMGVGGDGAKGCYLHGFTSHTVCSVEIFILIIFVPHHLKNSDDDDNMQRKSWSETLNCRRIIVRMMIGKVTS